MLNFNSVIFNKKALDYETGRRVYSYCGENGINTIIANSANIEGEGFSGFAKAKRTLFVTVKKIGKLESCKPSADYQLPLVSGCMGMCEYCYLSTRSGTKPVIKLYANTDELLNRAKELSSGLTSFELSASSDPVPLEPISGVLSHAVDFFGKQNNMRLRLATKFTQIDSLLALSHNGHTQIRYSINTNHIIKSYEHSTPLFEKRLEAAAKLKRAGYPIGFLIAPVFIYDNWQEDYLYLLQNAATIMPEGDYTFEIISHRFTASAKNTILSIFPNTTLDMEESTRSFKYGKFGYGKYVYTKEQLAMLKDFFERNINKYFKNSRILYNI